MASKADSAIEEKIHEAKLKRLSARVRRRREAYVEPDLRHLFIELTSQCNERCLHCGSWCDGKASPEVPTDKLLEVLSDVKRNFDIRRIMLCITGGEPLLRRDFFELMAQASEMGYMWGMTTNGTLITPEVARRLAECGMSTVSVSLDGLRATHDWFRSRQGSYDEAVRGIECLLDEGSFSHVQVTTVVHKRNIDELEDMFDELDALPIDSWRLAAMEPMGRALEHPDLFLDGSDHRRLLEFIRTKREEGWPLTYGCCHYLGPEFEGEVRDFFFSCSAGIRIASIMSNGDIGSCLDVERREGTIAGNVYRDDFVDVWRNRFGFMRRDLAELCEGCRACEDRDYCAGGSWHSFDFDSGSQRMCLKGTLFT